MKDIVLTLFAPSHQTIPGQLTQLEIRIPGPADEDKTKPLAMVMAMAYPEALVEIRSENGDRTGASAQSASDAVDRMANLVAFVDRLARMATEEESESGMVSEDSRGTLSDLITEARAISNLDPQRPKVYCLMCGIDRDSGKCPECGVE
jgi:hypothetical protein